MKNLYKILIPLTILLSFQGFSQQKTYDIVSYTPPKDWTEKQENDHISYSRIDGGSWAQIAIYQHRDSDGDIQKDFDKDWNELVANGKNISSPEKTKQQTAEGWIVMSGSGVWKYNGANVASILTIYTNKNVCIAVLCNSTAQPYLKEYQALLGSLDINLKSESPKISSQQNSTTTTNLNNAAIVGLWADYVLETSGYYTNGQPQYTAGYLRKEYLFKADGTYVYRNKQWLTKAPDINFVYETGTYTLSGNQLILIPKNAKSGFWAKTNSSKEWGSLKKYTNSNLATRIYNIEIEKDSTYGNSITLKPTKPDAQGDQFEIRYRLRDNGSLIDNPPYFK